MSQIIRPSQQNMSREQLAAIDRKQRMLTVLRKWEAFLNADEPEDIFKTEIAQEMQKNVGRFIEAFPGANVSEEDGQGMVLKLHSGARILANEQMAMKKLMEEQGQTVPDEAILSTIAQVVNYVEAIALHDPQVTAQPLFRAFALAIELGFIKAVQGQPEETPVED